MENSFNFETHDFKAALDKFVTDAQVIVDRDRNAKYPTLARNVLSVETGRRYVRVVQSDGTPMCRSVYCFVDTKNGDILKAASWKAPAKHARGNVFTGMARDAVNQYGANYLR
jgi:hypothetical protein